MGMRRGPRFDNGQTPPMARASPGEPQANEGRRPLYLGLKKTALPIGNQEAGGGAIADFIPQGITSRFHSALQYMKFTLAQKWLTFRGRGMSGHCMY